MAPFEATTRHYGDYIVTISFLSVYWLPCISRVYRTLVNPSRVIKTVKLTSKLTKGGTDEMKCPMIASCHPYCTFE